MADDPPRAGLPPADAGPGWPHRPADLDGPRYGAGADRPPWAQSPPGAEAPALDRPAIMPRPAGPPPGPPPARGRRRLVIVVVAVLALLGGVAAIGVLVSRRRTDDAAGATPTDRPTVPSTATTSPSAPSTTRTPSQPGVELTLLAGRVVVAARPGWEGLESADDNASVRLELREPTGRDLLSTLTIVTLSSPDSFDTTLKLDGGTPFEVKGVDGSLRGSIRPGATARIVAGADRPTAAFFLNVSIFSADGQDIDVATLRGLFTDQIAPALRFP